MTGFIVIGFVLLLLSGYGIVIYNGLVRLRNATRLAWSNIDVLLVQRHDELPKLVEVCRGYMQHERETLERVTRARGELDSARASGNVAQVSAAEGALRSGLAGLFAVAERYPDLKADTVFRNLAARISALETAIADRREVYNDSVNALNVGLESFPDALIAGCCRFEPARLLKFAAEATRDVDVKLALDGR